ncbi:GNAT family N-acetyltransferase [Halomarina oriensis]|uniref:GNAT family N-acetyltransferase n=1 Tax=Halomarina oriensis TaxID=671145 RepID=A0A6B0GHL4_9EURY|nr:GNAT family protein [Halomarina oriensis]MWG34224.1 GNAT family N-acetyltransferase [Halomarina oriensis]
MTLFPHSVETERLRLERLTSDDLWDLYDHARTDAPGIDEVTRHLTWDPHETPKVTRDFVTMVESQWAEGEVATYVVRPRDGEANAGEFGGATGLTVDWERRLGTLGLWLKPPLWGRGYSGERAGALLALAFDRLDLDVVAVTHDPANDASRRAIEKYVDRFGGRREGTFRHAAVGHGGGVLDHVRYSVAREEWRAAVGEDHGVRFGVES